MRRPAHEPRHLRRCAHVAVEIFSPLEKIAVDESAIDKATLAPIDAQLAVALGLGMRKDKEKRP